jgi:C-terminal processing protease CtpA/Prc
MNWKAISLSLSLLLLICLLPGLPSSGDNQGFERGRIKDLLAQVSRLVQDNYYDPKMKGLDWKALTDQAREQVDKAQTPGEMLAPLYTLVSRLHDSHTVFIPPRKTNRPEFGFEPKAYGDEIRIFRLKKEGPAKAAGLQIGDRILGISGLRAERGSIDLVMLTAILYRPQGALRILTSRGDGPPREVRVDATFEPDANVVATEDVYRMIFRDDRDPEEKERDKFHYKSLEGDIGYLQLPSFDAEPSALLDFAGKVKKSRAVIVDLRENGGGSVDALTAFAGAFAPEPTVIGTELKRNKTEEMKVKPQGPRLNVPMVVLVDSRSASASEVFARHFQLTKQAVVIGDRSAGKVTMARFFDGGSGAEFVVAFGVEVSVARLLLPNGEELEGKGVTPDQPCIPTPEEMRNKVDRCLGLAARLARDRLALPQGPSKNGKD